MQTGEERARLFTMGGSIFCLDLSHTDGQQAADGLGHIFPDVATALRGRSSNLHYLLALIPVSEKDISVMLTAPAGLSEAVAGMSEHAKKFGHTFAIVIAPKSDKVASLFAPLMDTTGTA